MLDRKALEERNIELKWRRYANDPELFFRECIWVPSQRDPRGREKFELFDYQVEDLRTLLGNRFVIGLKARQLGWSTLIAAILLHRCIFQPGSVCLWLSNSQDNANKAVNMLNTMWSFLPPWVRDRAPKLTSDQAGKKEWTFSDGMTSRIRALAGTATAGASETASIVVLDEFGLVDGHIQDDLYRSVDSTTDAGGSLWALSTARGAHNRFATMFKDAAAGISDKFVSMFRPWTASRFVNTLADAPGADECPRCSAHRFRRDPDCTEHVDHTIYNAKKREFNAQPWKFHAEYPSDPEEAFRESGNPRFTGLPSEADAFDGWIRGRMAEGGLGFPVFVEDERGPLRIREDLVDERPDDWRQYVVFVDPSKGVGGDYTAAHVLTMDEHGPVIAAWWHHNTTEPVEVAREMNLLGRHFHGDSQAALLAVESTGGWGDSMLTELHVHLHYPNLYRHTMATSTRRRPQQRLGFPLSHANRPGVIDRLADNLREDNCVGYIHPMLRQELATFVVTENGKIQADVGCHDDLVMSLAGGLWILTENARATNPPSSETRDDSDTQQTHSLHGLFEAIEQKRREVANRERKELERTTRRMNLRQRSRRRPVGAR